MRSVFGSGVSYASTVIWVPLRGLGLPCGGFLIHSSVAFASSAVKSVPSCYFTPLRSVNTIVVGSGCSHFSARSAMMSCGVLPGLAGSNCTS